jgi:3-oxoacyl-[acyl-carrier protein] reductase
MSLLENEVALVTGASRGIGRAIALELGRKGAIVLGTATTAKGAEAITAYLASEGIQGQGYELNVNDAVAVEKLVEEISASRGGVTVLVNNAGITRDNLLMRMKDEEWDDIISTNLTAVFRLTKLCLKHMLKKRHGRIISIGSVVGASGNPGQANYAAAKAGLVGFSKSLAREVGSRNVTANVVAPGFIATDMTDKLPDDQKDLLLGQIPMKRLGNPEEIAKAVAFLASPDASYITGETLHVNGGMYMS